MIPPAFRECRLYAKIKVTTQVDRQKVNRLKDTGLEKTDLQTTL